MHSNILKKVKFMRFLALFSVLTTFISFLPFLLPTIDAQSTIDNTDILEFTGQFDWDNTLDVKTSTSDYIGYAEFRSTYCVVASTASECASAANGKKIRFDTAEDLYHFSVDVSYEQVYQSSNPSENVKLTADKIAVLLSLDYVLGKNIDYSVMGAKTFIPIGYWFSDTQSNTYQNIFTGTFDGQGFTISNLYVAGYEYLVYVDEIDPLNTIDIALSSYYSMFPFNAGEIKNFGLLNPTFELLNLHIDINKVSNVVGINLSSGLVDHVYVIDSRTDVTEAGIRYKVGTSSEVFEAAGLVHTNQGTFTNSYYVSKVVVNGSYINKFSIQPVLYLNQGTISNLVYDSSVYLLTVVVGTSTFIIDTPNAYAVGEATSLLKSSSSSLNTATDHWYFYAQDCYPLYQGLVYDETAGAYLIQNAIDLAFFARVMAFVTERNGIAFSEDDYILTADIDMSVLSPGAYVTPTVTFYGTFSGYNDQGTDLTDNYYIYNLNLSQGTIRGTGYYVGLFSIIGAGAEVSNFNMNSSTYSLTNTENYYSNVFYAGSVAGRISSASMHDIIADIDINMGTQAIGKTYLGGIVGQASGVIERVSSYGTINMNSHTYQTSYVVNPFFSIGGVVGGADLLQLTLKEAKNYGAIYGFGTSSTFSFVSGVTSISSRLGGVIGYILNTSTVKHVLVDIANTGDIHVNPTINTVELPSTKKIGGVFGELAGNKPTLESAGEYLFANFYNEGDIYAAYASTGSVIKAAGIGVSNTTEAVEYALLFNHGTFVFDSTGASYTNQMFLYTGTIFDVSSYAVTLSRVYNYGNQTYSSNYFTHISPLYYSANNNATLIRYSANFGNISFIRDAGLTTITLATNLYVSGITTSSNVNYLNVTNKGTIDVVTVNIGSYLLYVSGITNTLTSGKYIKNSLNQGNISVAKITGTGNIFIGGIVNTNLSGDLHLETQSETQPIATIGIINTINYGAISSSYGLQAQNLYGINGTSNTFAGGIASLNAGSIQDAANLGDVFVYNSTTGSATFQTDTTYAGLVSAYTGGVVVGGIVAATLTGDARVYDTANNGNITALSNQFSRAGGVLGVSLYAEATSGGITAGMGLLDTIQNSILSNGLNLGDVSAITSVIGTYTTTSTSQSFGIYYSSGSTGATYSATTTTGTQERPQINASAGGVIGYGLSVMRRMLNHGTISSTDVAGGIVGATYVLGNVTTVVHINTAINYGGIKSVLNTNYSSINKHTPNVSSYYMADGNTFIFPSGYTVEMPRAKRGFGGIFGRLQRGLNGIMTSEGGEFDFIVNANPNIDLIGRLDQVYNFSSSSRYFRFNNAIFYSAKTNDTTQVVFTGFYFGWYQVTSVTGYSRNWTVTETAYKFEQVGIVATQVLPAVSLGTYVYTNTNRTAPTIGTWVTSPLPYYSAHIAVPWITENPSDPLITDSNTQYMYDPDFPMRTDAALTEYIYYMAYDLLASRFKTGGTNPRLNGMYVLSTTAGSTYGSVLPANIITDDIGLINEEYEPPISLLVDYDNMSILYHEDLDAAVLAKYNALRQTIFNEKSELIPSDTDMLTLTEDGGSDTILTNGTIDYDLHTVNFQISMEAFNDGQTTATYAITNALTSIFALIAETPNDYYGGVPSAANLLEYRTLLYPEKGDLISADYAPILDITLPSKSITSNVTLSLGTFTIFSEAFVGDDLFATASYYTTYSVSITFTPTIASISTGSIGITNVAFNGGSSVAVVSQSDVRSLGTVNATGSIQFYFEDTKGIFTTGYDFKDYFVLKYYDGSIVPSSYYTVTSTPVTINTATNPDTGSYDISFTFLEGIRMGDYYFEYRYFSSSSVLTVWFDKAASSQKSIVDFSYYSDLNDITINGTSITSYVNLGYGVSITTLTDNYTEYNNTVAPYLSNYTYDISFMTAHTLSLSPFAKVISARLVGITYNSGYKTYQMEYIIQAEDLTTQTYTHYLIERPIDLNSVLKNGNETELNDVYAIREDVSTDFTIDLGLDQNLDLYSITPGSADYISIEVSGMHLDLTTPYLSEEIVGITYTANEFLHIWMSFETLPGVYTFTFTLHRDGTANVVLIATTLNITKRAGTDSYLDDIRFSELANETEYPDFSITDSAGVINTSTGLDPRVYFDGIDYDDADILGYHYFRVDGSVANTPLNEYMPYMVDYLPYGASVSRRYYDTNTSSWAWTSEVTSTSTSLEQSVLLADFTVMPETGMEPLEGEEVVILYRVTSEDGMYETYYYVTVTDVTYNVTLIFDIYYCTDSTPESCTLASESAEFANQVVVINVRNLSTNGDSGVIGVTNPADYPTFSVVNAINNQMNQLYFTYSGDYRYSFGRNISGFYVFNIELPLDKYLNDMYTYEIQFLEYNLNDASNYVSTLEGKYFYIEYATKNRSRRFNVYIRPVETPSTAKPWGLFDFFSSWGNNN